jgi:uncharacterized NAD-dependent epimerase/dehydratase family protein
MTAPAIATPYLIFLGGIDNPTDAKTGFGLAHWRPALCVGQLRYPGCKVDLGLPEMLPAEAASAGARSLVIGVAPVGGRLEAAWLATCVDAMRAGLDIVSGLHTRLAANETLARVARDTGRRLIDVRQPPADIAIGSGRRRSGRRMLTVGTDCCVGKKYTALAMHRELRARKIPATFRATGQTGILIAGGGIPLDAVVSDFLSGAAEQLSPDNAPDHWDVIEGQGSLLHPAYAAVTLGLVHGSQPDALVLCHDASRSALDGYAGYPIPPLTYYIDRYLEIALLTNAEVRMVGVSLNTAAFPDSERERILSEAREQTGLPAADPIATGVGPLVDALMEGHPA